MNVISTMAGGSDGAQVVVTPLEKWRKEGGEQRSSVTSAQIVATREQISSFELLLIFTNF